jgi:hypothetical protein
VSGGVFPCVQERRTPYLLSTALIPSIFVSVYMSVKREEWEEIRVRKTPYKFSRGFNGDYRVKVTPDKLRTSVK